MFFRPATFPEEETKKTNCVLMTMENPQASSFFQFEKGMFLATGKTNHFNNCIKSYHPHLDHIPFVL